MEWVVLRLLNGSPPYLLAEQRSREQGGYKRQGCKNTRWVGDKSRLHAAFMDEWGTKRGECGRNAPSLRATIMKEPVEIHSHYMVPLTSGEAGETTLD
jgi:hypothetical protein